MIYSEKQLLIQAYKLLASPASSPCAARPPGGNGGDQSCAGCGLTTGKRGARHARTRDMMSELGSKYRRSTSCLNDAAGV